MSNPSHPDWRAALADRLAALSREIRTLACLARLADDMAGRGQSCEAETIARLILDGSHGRIGDAGRSEPGREEKEDDDATIAFLANCEFDTSIEDDFATINLQMKVAHSIACRFFQRIRDDPRTRLRISLIPGRPNPA